AAPLHKLLQRDIEFIWTDEHEEIFNWLKQQLITPPILQYSDYNVPFILFTDASYQGIGAILTQIKDKKEYVIAYAGRTLSPAEKNYKTYYDKDILFQETLLKRVFEIEDLFVKQQEAIQNIQEAQYSQKEYHNKNLKHNTLKIGDK
ncbi:19601_t:CDS:2, partial [Dentiscutata erythropus]